MGDYEYRDEKEILASIERALWTIAELLEKIANPVVILPEVTINRVGENTDDSQPSAELQDAAVDAQR